MIHLKKARQQLGLTQAKMGEALDCTRAFICEVEKGRSKLPKSKEKLIRLYLAGMVDPSWPHVSPE